MTTRRTYLVEYTVPNAYGGRTRRMTVAAYNPDEAVGYARIMAADAHSVTCRSVRIVTCRTAHAEPGA